MVASPALNAHRLRRVTKTGYWITMLLFTVNGAEMEYQEWHDSLFVRYNIESPDLPTHCDGCNAKKIHTSLPGI